MAGLRERKKAALRTTVVRTAVDLFSERGYDSVSVDDIVAAAMCSRSTFNRYFGTKEDVLFPGARDVTEGLRCALAAADRSEDPWEVARRSLVDQLERFVEAIDAELRTACLRLWFNEPAPRRRYLEIAREWEQILVDSFGAADAKNVEARVRDELVACAMIAALRTAMHGAIDAGEDVRKLADLAFDLLEEGLSGSVLARGGR